MHPTIIGLAMNSTPNTTCLIILLIALAVIIIGRFLLKVIMWIILIIIVLILLGIAGYFFKELFGLVIYPFTGAF